MTTNSQLFSSHQTPSHIYRRAAGIEPVGYEGHIGDAEATCAMCTAKLQPKDLRIEIDHETFGESFNNKLDMHEPGNCVCGDCNALWNSLFLQKYSKSFANKDGVFKLASIEDVQAFILTPPSAPFVAIFNTRQQQHMIWRTPVCMSQDNLIVRVDDDILHINRKRVIEAAAAWNRIIEVMSTVGLKGLPAQMDRELSHIRMGVLRSDVVRICTPHAPEDIAMLKSLRMGEWWALCAMRMVTDPLDASKWPKPVKLLPLPAGEVLPVENEETEEV